MNEERKWGKNGEWIETKGEEETFSLGKQMGRKAQVGEVYALIGDLGVGKTAFTKGFAAGMEVEDYVCSPTFTIVQIYEGGRLPLYHFDVYRIANVEEMEEIGFFEYLNAAGVCLIEWADRIEEILPESFCRIQIEKDLQKGVEHRCIKIERRGKEG